MNIASFKRGIARVFSSLLPEREEDGLTVTFEEAAHLLKKRSRDEGLRARVHEYLRGDIPAYFKEGPVICAARYVVSPNYETLRFLDVTKLLGLRVVLTQDAKDIFTPQNAVKKALCKMPICLRVTEKGNRINEHYVKVRVAEVNEAAQKPFADIKTLWGENLVSFHGSMFSKYVRDNVEVWDDSAWIDRNGRGELLELYKKYLALFVAHGALFEDFMMDDEYEKRFLRAIVRPAFRFVHQHFGVKPIIIQSVPDSGMSSLYWISYPPDTLLILRDKLRGLSTTK